MMFGGLLLTPQQFAGSANPNQQQKGRRWSKAVWKLWKKKNAQRNITVATIRTETIVSRGTSPVEDASRTLATRPTTTIDVHHQQANSVTQISRGLSSVGDESRTVVTRTRSVRFSDEVTVVEYRDGNSDLVTNVDQPSADVQRIAVAISQSCSVDPPGCRAGEEFETNNNVQTSTTAVDKILPQYKDQVGTRVAKPVSRRNGSTISAILVDAVPAMPESSLVPLDNHAQLNQPALNDAQSEAPNNGVYADARILPLPTSGHPYVSFVKRTARFFRIRQRQRVIWRPMWRGHLIVGKMLFRRRNRHESCASDQAIAISQNRDIENDDTYNSNGVNSLSPQNINLNLHGQDRSSSESTSPEQRIIACFERRIASLEDIIFDIVTSTRADGHQTESSLNASFHECGIPLFDEENEPEIRNVLNSLPQDPEGRLETSSAVVSNTDCCYQSVELPSNIVTSICADGQQSGSLPYSPFHDYGFSLCNETVQAETGNVLNLLSQELVHATSISKEQQIPWTIDAAGNMHNTIIGESVPESFFDCGITMLNAEVSSNDPNAAFPEQGSLTDNNNSTQIQGTSIACAQEHLDACRTVSSASSDHIPRYEGHSRIEFNSLSLDQGSLPGNDIRAQTQGTIVACAQGSWNTSTTASSASSVHSPQSTSIESISLCNIEEKLTVEMEQMMKEQKIAIEQMMKEERLAAEQMMKEQMVVMEYMMEALDQKVGNIENSLEKIMIVGNDEHIKTIPSEGLKMSPTHSFPNVIRSSLDRSLQKNENSRDEGVYPGESLPDSFFNLCADALNDEFSRNPSRTTRKARVGANRPAHGEMIRRGSGDVDDAAAVKTAKKVQARGYSAFIAPNYACPSSINFEGLFEARSITESHEHEMFQCFNTCAPIFVNSCRNSPLIFSGDCNKSGQDCRDIFSQVDETGMLNNGAEKKIHELRAYNEHGQETRNSPICTEYSSPSQSNKADGPVTMLNVIVISTSESDNGWLTSSVRWEPPHKSKRVSDQLTYRIWDIKPELSHFCTGTIFFRANAIYLLTCNTSALGLTSKYEATTSESEKMHCIRTYIMDQILPRIEQINLYGPGSLIIPVILAEANSDKAFVNHVLSLLRQALEDYRSKFTATRIFTECIVRIYGCDDHEGIQQLRERIMFASEDAPPHFLEHVRMEPPDGTLELREAIQKMKKIFPIISLEDLLKAATNKEIPEPVAKSILSFLRNTGEIIFYGDWGDESISEFVILSKKWLARVVSCISCKDFRKKIEQEHQFRRLCEGGERDVEQQDFPFDKFSRCPILSGKDAEILLKTENRDVVRFLERVFIHCGLFHAIVPNVFLVPRLVDSFVRHYDGWTYKCGESYNGSLCSLFTFACHQSPETVMAQLFARVISALSAAADGSLSQLENVQCWKNAFRLQWKSVDVFVVWLESWLDASASNMNPGTRSIAVFGKGNLAHIANGFRRVRDIVSDMLVTTYNSSSLVLCYECLRNTNPLNADNWSWDKAHESSQSDDAVLICKNGHRIYSTLASGVCKADCSPTFDELRPVENRFRECVVIVGTLNSESELISVASGFIVDAKRGLVATVGHAVYEMKNLDRSGQMLGCKAVIATVMRGKHDAPLWYFVEIEANDIKTSDLCILRICARVENYQFDQPGIPINLDNIDEEHMRELSLSNHLCPEERVRIVGYPHSKSENGLCSYVECVGGRIERLHKVTMDDDDGEMIQYDGGEDCRAWLPFKEIVVNSCSGVVNGQSGGPCLNEDGDVVGIYCRGQESHVDYLVPASEIKHLLRLCR